MRRTRLFKVIGVVAAACVCSGVLSSGRHARPLRGPAEGEGTAHALQSLLSRSVFLSCGPNDGELLNGIARLRVYTDYMEAGHILVFAGSQVVGSTDFYGAGSYATVRTIHCQLDTTQFENSRVELRFVLFTPGYAGVLAFDRCEVSVQNPYIDALEGTPGMLSLWLQGHPDDTYYQLAVGNRTGALQRVPDQRSSIEGVQLLARGNWSASPTSPKTRKIVTNLDILFRIHGLNTQLVLWTYNSKRGWARSAITRIQDLVPDYRFPTTYSESLQPRGGGSGR